MTITYVLQVLQAMEDGKIQDSTYIKDLEGELHKAFRRVRRRLLRLRSRAQYEIGEMDRAKVSATSGHMEEVHQVLRHGSQFQSEGLRRPAGD